MNGTDPYFKKLKDKSIFLYDFCNSIIENLDYQRKKIIQLPEFKALKINESSFIQEPIIKKIHETFEIGVAAMYILEKNTGCDFHIDEPEVRNVAINMLLSSGVSHSVFKTKQENSYNYEFKELIFEKKSLYLYNVSKPHAVMNFDKTRYMFSVKFKDGKLSYDELFKWCEENNLLENQNINK
jgi:hypothetical protein